MLSLFVLLFFFLLPIFFNSVLGAFHNSAPVLPLLLLFQIKRSSFQRSYCTRITVKVVWYRIYI